MSIYWSLKKNTYWSLKKWVYIEVWRRIYIKKWVYIEVWRRIYIEVWRSEYILKSEEYIYWSLKKWVYIEVWRSEYITNILNMKCPLELLHRTSNCYYSLQNINSDNHRILFIATIITILFISSLFFFSLALVCDLSVKSEEVKDSY